MINIVRPGGAGTLSPSVRSRARPGTAADQGTAAVEMALVLPVLLMLVFMIIDFGRAYIAQARLNEAARQGVRTTVLTQSATPDADPRTAAVSVMRDALMGLTTPSPNWVEPCAADTSEARVTTVYAFKGTLFDRRLTGHAAMQCPS